MNDWFFYQERGTTVGPYTLEDLRLHIREGRLSVHDLIYRDGEESWQIASQHPAVRSEFKMDMDVGLEDRPWVCLHRKAEDTFDFVTVGPFSDEDIREGLASGQLAYGDYAWKHGMAEWIRIGSTERFNARLHEPPAPATPAATTSGTLPLESEDTQRIEHTELLRDVFRLERIEPESPSVPPEAAGEDLTKLTASFEFDPDRTRVTGLSQPVPAPAKISEMPPSPVENSKRSIDASPIIDAVTSTVTMPGTELKSAEPKADAAAPIVASSIAAGLKRWRVLGAAAGVAFVFIAGVVAYFLTHRHAPAPVAVVPPPAKVMPTPPAPAPVVPRVIPPSQIQLGASEVDGETAHIELRTDASENFPIALYIFGLPGQVATGPSSFASRSLKATGQITAPIAVGDVKLAPGSYLIRAEAAGVRREVSFKLGLMSTANGSAIARRRKLDYHAIFRERLLLYKTSLLAETSASGPHATLPRELAFLNDITPGGANKIFLSDWLELKEAVEQARTQPAPALERVRKLRQKIAGFSVWGAR